MERLPLLNELFSVEATMEADGWRRQPAAGASPLLEQCSEMQRVRRRDRLLFHLYHFIEFFAYTRCGCLNTDQFGTKEEEEEEADEKSKRVESVCSVSAQPTAAG